jgi:heme oxygenase
MPVSNDLKVFWFTPIRAATRSCDKILKYLDFTDLSHREFDNELQKTYFFVSNIRNPYSRLVSIYHIYCYHQKREPNDFRDWVIKKLRQEVEFPVQALNYQINLSKIFSSHDKIPDYFVRVESLEEDIRNLWFVKENMSDELESYIQEGIVLNKYKNEFGEKEPWQEKYNQSLSNYVYSFLEKDFLLFGYDRNSWKDGTP